MIPKLANAVLASLRHDVLCASRLVLSYLHS
jgi:hypothetical protein